ncbi:MAG: type II 3-dehydroquinate dehydratase [Clostridiaceae bacterium]|jgi:3-dehydroquinate dehydratase-2|nr:type II 3-dehydroquinate dehydratase [Bacillota bacterium]NLN51415.1 type II 3-dehydroquinate dehydratase [Clostridiaceae bacterium]
MKIMIINGPNLNLLGIREPDLYGKETYEQLTEYVNNYAKQKGFELTIRQSNHEGDLIDYIQEAYFENIQGIVINPAAYTHTSVGLLDAIKAVNLPTVEVHLSDVAKRENYRQISYIREACLATVSGKGFSGYLEALDILLRHLTQNSDGEF